MKNNYILQSVRDAVIDFVNAERWAELKRIVETRQTELFSNEARWVFDDLVRSYSGDERAVRDLEGKRALLEQCKVEGIDKAFTEVNPMLDPRLNQAIEEFLFMPANWSEARRALLKWQYVLVSYEALRAIDETILPIAIEKSDEDFVRFIKTRRDLLERALLNGMQPVLEQIELLELADSLPEHIRQKVFNVRSREEAIAVVSEYPKTWTLMEKLFVQSDPDWTRLLEQVDKIEQAIKEMNKPHEMPGKITLCKQAIELLEKYGKSELWAQFQGIIANSYAQNSIGNRPDDIELALIHYQKALEVYTLGDHPFLWAMTQFNLGVTYNKREKEDRVDNIELAILHHEEALKIIMRENNKIEWADIQHALGNCYLNRYKDPKAKNIEKAIAYFAAALRAYEQESSLDDIAMANASLAQAYRMK